jgi:5-methylcytosine-specific restriction endonuclease McrA
MKTIPKFPVSGLAIFDACAVRSNDDDLIARLQRGAGSVARAEKQLLEDWAAGDPSAYLKRQRYPLLCDANELKEVYKRVLTGGNERPTYEKIKASAGRICPQCGVGRIRNLDHYLPISQAPELSVVPSNLIPVCGDCNFEKLNQTPDTLEECVFNPYFDDWSGYSLLYASVVLEPEVVVNFRIDQPEGCPDEIFKRAKATFSAFNFDEGLSVAASGMMKDVKNNCQRFANVEEPERSGAVRDWLQDQYNGHAEDYPNGWRAAMYRAYLESDEFVDGGYKLLP